MWLKLRTASDNLNAITFYLFNSLLGDCLRSQGYENPIIKRGIASKWRSTHIRFYSSMLVCQFRRQCWLKLIRFCALFIWRAQVLCLCICSLNNAILKWHNSSQFVHLKLIHCMNYTCVAVEVGTHVQLFDKWFLQKCAAFIIKLRLFLEVTKLFSYNY